MDKRILQEIGLSEGEAEVYLALLETGSTTAGPVIKKTGLHRATTYTILQRLIEKGLVTYIITGKKRHFEAADPETLMEILKEKEEKLRSILPQLKVKKEHSKTKQEIKIYEGFRGLKTTREKALRVLKKGEMSYVLGASTTTTERFNQFWKSWNRRRSGMGIKSRMLWTSEAKKYARERAVLPHTEVKFLPIKFPTPLYINVYRDYTDIGLTTEKPFIVEIKNKQVADSFRKYFDILWNQDVKILKGFKEVTNRFYSRLEQYKKGEEYQVLGATYEREIKKELIPFFIKYHNYRLKKRVKVALLGNYSHYEALLKEMADAGDKEMRLSRVSSLPKGIESPMQINLYKKEIILVLWSKEPIAFSIENKKIRDSFKNYFDQFWKLSSRTSRAARAGKKH